MTWVRHAEKPVHTCQSPMREATYRFPSASLDPKAEPAVAKDAVVDGAVDDLWRCDDCRTLWRVADACDACDAYGHRPHGGMCTIGLVWRPATLWQRIRNWRTR